MTLLTIIIMIFLGCRSISRRYSWSQSFSTVSTRKDEDKDPPLRDYLKLVTLYQCKYNSVLG